MLAQVCQEFTPRLVGERYVSAHPSAVTLHRQSGDELAAKHLGQCLNRKQEATLGYAPLPIVGERAPGHQGVQVKMSAEVLRPGVQHQAEGERPAQPAGVAAKLSQGLRDRLEQHLVDHPGRAVPPIRSGHAAG